MDIVLLIIGTVLTFIFLLFLFRGKKYDYMVESLSGDEFPLKMIYSVGFGIQDLRIGRLRGTMGEKLRKNSTLYYSRQYSEFYSRVAWAQVISFALFILSLFFVLAGLLPEMAGFLGLVGILACALTSYYFLNYTKSKITTRQEECEAEFPNAISKLALIVNSGVILHEAWEMIAYGKEGVYYDLMRASCESMKNGKSDIEAFHDFGVLTNSDDIRKFTSALIQSIERGGGELPQFLENQSSELWAHRRQVMLQKGEKAASALLAPIALMFIGVMLIVIVAAIQSLSV